MRHRKRFFVIGIMMMLVTMMFALLPTKAGATSSSEILKQINQLKKEKEELQEKIKDVQGQYEENEDEIADIIAQKSVIDQEIQLLSEQITNIHDQLSAFNLLIADKQDELDYAEDLYSQLNDENKLRIRTMEEEGELTYWEVLFKANTFSDLLDRLNMVEEIAASDKRRLKDLSDAAEAVKVAQESLQQEKDNMESTKQELYAAQLEMDSKLQKSMALLQELLIKADDLEALEEAFEAQEAEFLKEIAAKEDEYNAAKQAEWSTYSPTSAGASGGTGNTNAGTAGTGGTDAGGGWVRPCSYTSITSPFGNRVSPTTGASTYHQGVDLDTGTGWPVVAAKAGRVTLASYTSSAGNYVKIDHGGGVSSIYMHLSNYCVSAGQTVSAGQQIGTTGATGVATGDHLHFGISVNGVFVNPCNYVNLT